MKPLTPSQQMLVDDGLPAAFLRDPDAPRVATGFPPLTFMPTTTPEMTMTKGAVDQIAALRIKRAEEAEAANKQAAKADTKVAASRKKLAAADAPKVKARKVAPAKLSKSEKSVALKGPTEAAGKVSAKAAPEQPAKPGSKLEAIAGLLTRPGGCTVKDVLAATGWPSVSMPAQAKAAGLTLKKEKRDGVWFYTA